MKKILLLNLLLVFFNILEAKNPVLVINTTEGDMTIELYEDTPLHTENFLKLIEEGFYDGLLFHRVIKDFMIQTGDPNSRNAKPGQRLGYGGPDYTIPQEFRKQYYHKKGALAAARQGNESNPLKSSSSSQFYIVQGQKFSEADLQKFVAGKYHIPFTEQQIKDYTTIGGTPHLDYEYTVFGQVIKGLEIIDKIAAYETDPAARPLKDVKIIQIKVISK